MTEFQPMTIFKLYLYTAQYALPMSCSQVVSVRRMILEAPFNLFKSYLQILLCHSQGFPTDAKSFFGGWFGNDMEVDVIYFLI